MDLSFKHGRRHTQVLSLWAWFCFVLLGSSLTYSQSTLTWNAQPSNQTVEKGATVTFRCSAYYGGKALEYHWVKDGENIQTDSLSRFSIQDDGTLEITSTQLDDRGEYSCYVKRQGRTKTLGHSKSATLSVTGLCSAVQLSVRPDVGGYTFLAGKSVQLRCKCYMNPPGTYAFTKDGSSVTTDSRVTIDRNKLYLENATESDSGEYSCLATSADSLQTVTPTKNLPISVVVGQHPRFQLPPPTKSVVLEGSQVDIPCLAIGKPEPLIKWYAGSDKSPLQNDSKYNIAADGTLQIKNVGKRDAQTYKCKAENLVGTVAKDTVVELAYLDPVTVEKEKVYVLVNERTEVHCNKPRGNPEPNITWEKGGEKLPKRFGVEGCCTLLNNKTRKKDSGKFTCTASNGYGSSHVNVEIIVSELPEIVTKPKNQTVKEGETVYLDCETTSHPVAKISWTKDGTPFVTTRNIRLFLHQNGTLVISKAKTSDSGTYSCIADHPGGWTESAVAKVEVMGFVRIKSIHYHVVNANLHTRQRIECNFEGYPPITVSWKKAGGEDITQLSHIKHENNELHFKSIEKTDQGQYLCTGENSFSVASDYVNISVFVYPIFVVRPKNTTAFVNQDVWLHCNASGEPKPKISWSKDVPGGYKLDPKRFIQYPNGTLHIKEVHFGDKGRYYCIAANHAEMKQSKFSLDVHSPIDDVPSDVDKSVGSMGRTIGIAVGCAAAYIVLVVGLMIYCKGRRARQAKRAEVLAPECENLKVNGDIEHGDGNDMSMNPVYRSQPSYDNMEFPRHDLESLRSLGNGAYGRAFLARASGICDGEKETMVVVKSLNSNDDQVQEEFHKEMESLVGLRHDNVVTLLGVCKEGEPIYMIFESLDKGDLKQYLLSCHDNGRTTLNSNQKLAICGQVAAGMEYLSLLKLTHKDLAARNCMVGRDLQVKIGYLSLSYDLYNAEYYRFNNMQIPLRWMPPEAICDDEFSEKSDVWSFGVLAWEIYTFGQMPYHDLTNEEVLKGIRGDLRLPKPENCPDTVLEMLAKCWEGNPLSRPTFMELVGDVSEIRGDSHV